MMSLPDFREVFCFILIAFTLLLLKHLNYGMAIES